VALRSPASRGNQATARVKKKRPPCPEWLADIRGPFKRYRMGRPGWFVDEHRHRIRLVSHELPPRPGEVVDPGRGKVLRSLYLEAPPGPNTTAAAITELCAIFDGVIAGTWSWPDEASLLSKADPSQPISSASIEAIAEGLRALLVGEQLTTSTWQRTWEPYLKRLSAVAAERQWPSDSDLLQSYLRHWLPNTRSRQMAYDRARRLWKEVRREWPESLAALRGNGSAVADPQGVSAITDEDIEELRARIQRSSRLTPADLVAWDCVIVFGLRPVELQGLLLEEQGGSLCAHVQHQKRNSKGAVGARIVIAVPPASWPLDCFELFHRWQLHGFPPGMVAARSPGQVLTQQLRRLRAAASVLRELDPQVTSYGCRHAYALRLGIELGLDVRSAAKLCGHTPRTHLQEYGRRLEVRKLTDRVSGLVRARAAE
jgi:integrase